MRASIARALSWSAIAVLAMAALGSRPSPTRIVMDARPGELLSIDRVPRLAPPAVRAGWRTDTDVVAGAISSNLYAALDSCAATLPEAIRAKLAWSIADVFEYRIDLSRDLQPGDSFRVLFERVHSPDGGVKLGRVLAATLRASRDTIEAIRYDRDGASPAGGGDFFDAAGKSLRSAFLRAPVEFRRISSDFGMRWHPILGMWKKHMGTDYVAARGTPVRAVADGVVAFAGWRGGYGNFIEIEHPKGMVTRYGHMSRFARGIRTGAHVDMGSTIGYVGMTGLATAPHLHFEVLVDGNQRDPRVALSAPNTAQPLAPDDLPAFNRERAALLAALVPSPAPAR